MGFQVRRDFRLLAGFLLLTLALKRLGQQPMCPGGMRRGDKSQSKLLFRNVELSPGHIGQTGIEVEHSGLLGFPLFLNPGRLLEIRAL